MNIESIIIDQEPSISSLRKCLHSKFPEITIRGEASTYAAACQLIRTIQPTLVFSDPGIFIKNSLATIIERNCPYEIIYASNRSEDAIQAIRQGAFGFILKPLSAADIVESVGNAVRKLNERLVNQDTIAGATGILPHTRLIGIPTLDGIEFLHFHEIVRCEGLQKCTRIVSTRKSNMISAYNIGEFRKMLDEHGFFSCHKSHLINLMHVKKLSREGFIFLVDNIGIPLARRKRLEFLHLLKHL